MASFLDDIADYLEDQSIGTVGTDIFVGKLPPSPDNCVAVLGSASPILPQGKVVSDLMFPAFQIIVRNSLFSAGSTKAGAIRDALHVALGLQLAHHYALVISATAEPQSIGQDELGREEFSLNFNAKGYLKDA